LKQGNRARIQPVAPWVLATCLLVALSGDPYPMAGLHFGLPPAAVAPLTSHVPWTLAYSSFLGGSQGEEAWSVAVDPAGSAYVTGCTESADFPTTLGAYDTSHNGLCDVFVSKFSSSGSLVYSTLIGTRGMDAATAIAVDATGNVYLAGVTDSGEFPTTTGAFDTTFNGGTDAFVLKLDSEGRRILYATLLGGRSDDWPLAIDVDESGSVYVTGRTDSSDFPLTAVTSGGSYKGASDVFVTKLSPDGGVAEYSTLLGGAGDEQAFSMALSTAGSVFVTGRTDSVDFVTTAGAWDLSYSGGPYDAFVSKLDASGNLLFSTFLGGGDADEGLSLDVDHLENVYVTGSTRSNDFPSANQVAGPFAVRLSDAFVAKINATGSRLVYSTLISGGDNDWGAGISLDEFGRIFLSGVTFSMDFPIPDGAFDASYNGEGDGFIIEIAEPGGTILGGSFLGGRGADYIRDLALDNGGNIYVIGSTVSADFPVTTGALATALNGYVDAFVVRLGETPGANIFGPPWWTWWVAVPLVTASALAIAFAALRWWRKGAGRD